MIRMRAERKQRGWSLVDLCTMTGISPSDLSLVERGKREAFPGWKRRISKAFELGADELFQEVGDD
jgi:transcriptional regulator with XRE-family HTH domain